jgi:hypothetical protein
MPTSLPNFRPEFRAATLELLWQQWTTLGVSGHTASASTAAMIDPEALLLTSTTLARLDPRLFDEMLDWLQDQADWINLQRLVRLQKDFALGTPSILAAIATCLARHSSHQKWRVLAKPVLELSPPAPLFPEFGHFGGTDPDFLTHGWQRGPVRYRGLGTAPRMDHPSNLLLKLRALFGRQSRAEVMAWLLAHDSGHPAEIARQTGHFRRSIQLTLNELERSGHIRARKEAREKHFSLDHNEWRFLITQETPSLGTFPHWIKWARVFRLLIHAQILLDDSALADASPELQAIEWHRQLDYTNLADAGLPVALAQPIAGRGIDALTTHVERLRQIFQCLSPA